MKVIGDICLGLCGVAFLWCVLFYEPHICSVVGVERCHEATGRKHG
jgi:hypothetical protein